jgi:hypothetical protein
MAIIVVRMEWAALTGDMVARMNKKRMPLDHHADRIM